MAIFQDTTLWKVVLINPDPEPVQQPQNVFWQASLWTTHSSRIDQNIHVLPCQKLKAGIRSSRTAPACSMQQSEECRFEELNKNTREGPLGL